VQLQSLLTLIAVSSVVPALGSTILGSAGNFVVLGGSTVTNTGSTTLTGDMGVYPGTSITDLSGITVNGAPATGNTAVHITDATAQQAQSDLVTAFSSLSIMGPVTDLGTDYATGNETLLPGVYSTPASTFDVNGALTLNFQGQSNASFVFLVGSSLTAEVGSQVILENVGANDSVYWVMPAGAATILAGAAFEGNILANAGITFGTGATDLCGRALAQTPGGVTMQSNTLSIGCQNAPVTTTVAGGGSTTATGNSLLEGSNGLSASGGTVAGVPEPGSAGLLALGGLLGACCGWMWRTLKLSGFQSLSGSPGMGN
jgi:hypothetical protein